MYSVGVYYLVNIGDLLNSNRCRVIHKLGFGSSATIWLARDTYTDTNVAIKIQAAVSNR